MPVKVFQDVLVEKNEGRACGDVDEVGMFC